MAIHWQVKFRGVRSNTLYTVNIYDNNYSGTAILLKGAAQPFTTQEDNNTDWFTPVRLQSGYLRIVDDGYDDMQQPGVFNWRDLLPTDAQSRKVTLTHTSGNATVIDWQGFLQPQTFSGILYENVQIREFPLVGPLDVLSGIDVDTTINGAKNFGYIIYKALSQSGINFDRYIFQGGDAVNEWLFKQVDWRNFLNDDGTAKYDYLTLIQEVCKFFGWTCRTHGADIYFLSPDDNLSPAFVAINEQDLDDIADGRPAQYTTLTWGYYDISEGYFISANNGINILRGVSKATVTSNVNKRDIVLSIPFNAIRDDLGKNPPTSYILQDNVYYFEKTGVPDESVYNDVIVQEKYSSDQEFNDAAFNISETWDKPLNYLHNYDWVCALIAEGTEGSSSVYKWNRIVSSQFHSYDHGILYINGTIKAAGEGQLLAKLKIGNKYWNGSSWTTTESTFTIYFGVEGDPSASGDLPITDTRQRNDPYPNYNGVGIPITDAIGGIIQFDFALSHVHGAVTYETISASIKSLEIGFLRHNNYAPYNDDEENVYTQNTGNDFVETKDVSTIFACDKGNAFGYGIVLNEDYSYCTRIGYSYSGGIQDQAAEQHLLNRIIDRLGCVRENLELYIDASEAIFTPLTMCEGTSYSYYPIAFDQNWRAEETKLTLIELSEI